MPAARTMRRGAVGACLLAAALGAASASAAEPGPPDGLTDPAPAVAVRGVPLERLPEEPEVVPTGRPPVATPGAVLLGAGAGALVLLVLRQRRLAADPGPTGAPGVPDLATGTPALVHALATGLAEGTGPVGLVLLRVEAPIASAPTREQEWEAADAVLEALDVAVPVVAEQVGQRARAGDGVVRLGMNRLAVVLPGSGPAEARTVAERLRAGVAAHGAPGLSVHAGWAGSPVDGTVPSALLRAAERSLRQVAAREPLPAATL